MNRNEVNHLERRQVPKRIYNIKARSAQFISHLPRLTPAPEFAVNTGEKKKRETGRIIMAEFSNNWPLNKIRLNDEKQNLFNTNVSEPIHGSFVWITGVKLSDKARFELIDNAEKVDPTLRIFLEIAGLSEKLLINQEKKIKIKQWLIDNNIYKIMDKQTQKHRPPPRAPTPPTHGRPEPTTPQLTPTSNFYRPLNISPNAPKLMPSFPDDIV